MVPAGRRCHWAICKASTTSSVRMWSAIDHPTIRRDQTSMTAAQYTFPLGGGVFGDVGAPQPVRAVGDEPPADQVLVGGGQRPGPGPFPPVGHPDQPGRGHQPGDPLAPAGHPGTQPQVGMDPRGTVGLPGSRVGVPDLREQLLVTDFPRRGLVTLGVVVGGAWQLEHPGRSPRRGTRRRPAHGPAGPSFWEDVLAGEQRRGPLEDLDLHLHRLDTGLAAQPDQLGPLVPGQPLGAAGLDVLGLDPPGAGTTPRSPGHSRSSRPGTPRTGPAPPPCGGTGGGLAAGIRTPPRSDHHLRPGVRKTGSGSLLDRLLRWS